VHINQGLRFVVATSAADAKWLVGVNLVVLTSRFEPSSWMGSASNFRYGIPQGKSDFAQSQQVLVFGWLSCGSVEHEYEGLVVGYTF